MTFIQTHQPVSKLSPDQIIPPASGLRRFTPAMLAARDRADAYTSAARGAAKPFRYLAAFQEAEPYLGLPPQAYKLLAWLVKQTMAQDWEEGSRPVCWPSAARQEEFLGLSQARVKTLNRALYEAEIFILRDSETGKRYGRRGPDNRIIEAFGFDLSPLAYRFDEFIRIAAEARAERDQRKALRKRATRARRAVRQIGETLAALGAVPAAWPQLAAETAELVTLLRTEGDLASIVKGLESRKSQAETWLREASPSVETSPKGLADEPHIISTNKPLNPKDTVIASEVSSPGGRAGPVPSPTGLPAEDEDKDLEPSVDFKPFQRVEKLHPGELLELAPRLDAHVTARYPGWADIVAAAGTYLRHELGVSQALWGDSCRLVGRQLAAVILAVVSTKPPEHFTRGAGGYFAAMVKRAQTGELHLDRSLWKLRRARWDRPPAKSEGLKPEGRDGFGAVHESPARQGPRPTTA
jgi:replication initiation protein RepC